MGHLALSFRRWDYSSILRTAVSPILYRIGVNHLCISIVCVLNKTLTKKRLNIFIYLHAINSQHQINCEHANVILNY